MVQVPWGKLRLRGLLGTGSGSHDQHTGCRVICQEGGWVSLKSQASLQDQEPFLSHAQSHVRSLSEHTAPHPPGPDETDETLQELFSFVA